MSFTAGYGTKNELVTDSDFESYLTANLSRLPSRFQNVSIVSFEDISGNVNRVKRVNLADSTDYDTTVIIKHVPHRGMLARFPSIQFSSSRLEFENKWFDSARQALTRDKNSLLKLPEIYYYDQNNRVLIMEDLGVKSLSDAIASGDLISSNYFELLGSSLRFVHDHSRDENKKLANEAAFQNRPFIFETHIKEPDSIREIWTNNYKSAHITLEEKINFQKSFLESYASAIEPVLNSLSKKFIPDANSVFTHGDLHTRSIIVIDNDQSKNGDDAVNSLGFGVIDSELSDYGSPEFDLGFLLAHLIAEFYATGISNKQSIQIVVSLIDGYGDVLDREVILNFTGAEMLRRLLGPAGFYQDLNKTQFEFLLNLSKEMLLQPGKVLDNMKNKASF